MVHCDVVASGYTTISFLSLSSALLGISALVPSHCLHVDFLSRAGRDGELMIGAGLAGCGFSAFLIGVVKDEEVSSTYLRGVMADLRLNEAFLVISDWHEEYSIIFLHRPNLLSQVSCPQFGAVRIGSVVRFYSPGVPYFEEFDGLAFCVFELVCAQDCVGVAHRETI